ncbi:MAG: hypothetical protein KDK36_02130 [Leptospiraceae bacterium]|nr:hypothetical protein [Leptospiraceae bacterium]
MGKNTEVIKTIGQQAAVIGGSYLLSKFIGVKVAEKIVKPTSEAGDAEMKRAIVGVAITGLSIYAYDKIDNKLIASGLIAGSGLNAVVEVLRIPKIKSSLPSSMQTFLGSDGGIYVPNYQYDQQSLMNEVKRQIEAAQVAGHLGQDRHEYDNVYSTPIMTIQGDEVGRGYSDPTFSGNRNPDPTFSGDDDEMFGDEDLVSGYDDEVSGLM